MPNGNLAVTRRYDGDADRQIEALLLLLQPARGAPEPIEKPTVGAVDTDEKGDVEQGNELFGGRHLTNQSLRQTALQVGR